MKIFTLFLDLVYNENNKTFHYVNIANVLLYFYVVVTAFIVVIHLLIGGDEESRTPVRKCRPMNFSERRPCLDLKPFSYKDKLDDSSL